MTNTKRIPFVLNLDDPIDAAIWEALEPMLERRRASAFIRGAVAHALGVGGLLPAVVTPQYPALPAGDVVKAKRPTLVQTVQDTDEEAPADSPDDLAAATDNFLSMFG